jgi:hypothetical protein
MLFDTTVKRAGLLLPGMLWLLMSLVGTAVAQGDVEPLEVTDIRICNLRGNTFAVTWRTNQATSDNVVKLGFSSGELTDIREDQLDPPSQIHYVESGLLNIDTTYYYVVSSDGVEGASSPVGYDSVITVQQTPPTIGALIAGNVINAESGEPLPNVIVRSFYRWTRQLQSETQIDSTMWQTDLTNADGEFDFGMGNFRRYNHSTPYYAPGNTWLFLEILSQTSGEIATDSVLLTFATNNVMEYQILAPYEITVEPVAEPGDVDGDGVINIFDLLDILSVISGKVVPDPRMSIAADVDDSGKIDIFDVLALLNKIRQAGTASS